jgi:preprotein translocase subunit SecG
MQTVIIVIHLMLVLGLIGVALLQRSEGGGLGAGGSSGGFLSSRGTANVLTRTTALLAAGFFATSLVLSILAGMGRKPTSILGTESVPAGQQAPASAPLGPGGVLDALRGAPQPQQPAPPPSGPQVPQSQ